ncbi:MAG: hypothetical protein AB8B95_10235 [Pseudohongiellaceae bacterium]
MRISPMICSIAKYTIGKLMAVCCVDNQRALSIITVLLATASMSINAAECHENEMGSINCGSAYSAVVDSSGTLWISYVQDQHVFVSRSQDRGKSFLDPVKVNELAESIEHNGENRPKIIVTPTQEVLVSWTLKTSNRYTGEIRFSRSADGGKNFSVPRTINDDGLKVGHRFESMFLTESGHLYLAWIDKRELHASIQAGEEYAGAAIYYAVSDDLGKSFSPNFPVSSNSCECCRIAIAPRGQDKIAILWRQIYGEQIRDHAFAVLSPHGVVSQLARASVDDWYINACPHHGPAMVEANTDNEFHIAWFSNGDIHQGIHYARYAADTAITSNIYPVDKTPGAGHPSVAVFEDRVYLVWKGFDGRATQLNMIVSEDGGANWSQPETLYSTALASDYPFLVQDENGLYLSWHSEEYGYLLSGLKGKGAVNENI